MRVVDAKTVATCLPWDQLIAALREMFRGGCEAPLRHHHEIQIPMRQDATMLLMPAWQPGRYSGLKLLNIHPDNPQHGLPAIMGSYLLMDGENGSVLAIMDAGELTSRRTAAASALASWSLSREDASRLLIVGSGRLARYLAHAHGAVRNLQEVRVWARDGEKAEAVADSYRDEGISCTPVRNLEDAVRWADIISCATMAKEPLVRGAWLQKGAHLDLIGGFTPEMHEADSEAITRATVFVDTRDGVLSEAGDLLTPIAEGLFAPEDIAAELSQLIRGEQRGRREEDEITLFKSVGASLEDLAAAVQCYENLED